MSFPTSDQTKELAARCMALARKAAAAPPKSIPIPRTLALRNLPPDSPEVLAATNREEEIA
jgi:hypothetical protein